MNPSIYLGLFLIGFALYAKQSPVAAPVKTIVVNNPAPTEEPTKSLEEPSAKLQSLYSKLRESALLQKKVDGLTVEYQDNSIMVKMISDELYEEGVYSMRENWIGTLDHLAELIKPEQKKGLRIKIHSYTDQDLPREVKSGDFGASSYTLSALRGEWVAHYLERQWEFELPKKIDLVVHGAIIKGRRLDLELYYQN